MDLIAAPKWVYLARIELGISEIPGRDHNPRILEYHKATSLKATDDETPWCSAFMNFIMKLCKLPGTDSAAARSWLKYGVGLNHEYPAFGAITVLSRGNSPTQGHVGIYLGSPKDGVISLLAGNQGDKVSISNFPKSQVIDYRWPS